MGKIRNLIIEIFVQITPSYFVDILKKYKYANEVDIWLKNGSPSPPPHKIKQETIEEYRKKYGYTIFVESGTYRGDMVEAQKSKFMHVISIELGSKLYEKACRRFKNDKNVRIIYGDSGKILPDIVNALNSPAIFWLDGHYSGGITAKGEKECPIFEEIDAILSNNTFDHILLIDDARCFNDVGDYPSIETLTDYVKELNSNYQVDIKHDIIRLTPQIYSG